jgi:hypothetical protein
LKRAISRESCHSCLLKIRVRLWRLSFTRCELLLQFITAQTVSVSLLHIRNEVGTVALRNVFPARSDGHEDTAGYKGIDWMSHRAAPVCGGKTSSALGSSLPLLRQRAGANHDNNVTRNEADPKGTSRSVIDTKRPPIPTAPRFPICRSTTVRLTRLWSRVVLGKSLHDSYSSAPY